MDVQDRTPTEASKARADLEQIPGSRYHAVERLSMGAIGAVYKALDTILDRPVAVKSVRLDTPFADHTPDELRERFVREARIAARLQHPNIVTTHDIVATDTRGFIIMEFIEGQSLESLLKTNGRLELSKAIRILTQLSSALDYAHGRNVVHRDVKPSNILVSPEMNVWVTDFGIAKSELSTNLTMAGGVLGTPDYMSPEQAKGEDVDARSDLFSLGCILFECATGEKPFRNPSLTGVLLSIINDEPAFPLNWHGLGMPTRLKPILYHALEKDPEERYPTGAALVEALAGLPADEIASADEAALEAPETSDAPASGTGSSNATAADGPGSEASVAVEEPETSDERQETGADRTESDSKRDEAGKPAKAPWEESAATPTGSEAAPPAATKDAPEVSKVSLDAELAVDVEKEPDADVETKSGSEGAELADVSGESPSEQSTSESTEAEPDEACETKSDVEAKASTPAEEELSEPERPAPTPIEPERVESLKSDGRPLRLSPTLSAVLHKLEISPEEGFILSRVDGGSRASEILALSPMPETESARALFLLLDKDLIQFGGTPVELPKAVVGNEMKVATQPVPQEPDEAILAEIERLLSLADARAWGELLGVDPGSPEKVRKSAYVKIIGKFHPDKFSWAKANGFQEKLSRLCAAASEAVDELASAKQRATEPPEAAAPSNGNGTLPLQSAGGSTGVFDKRKYARDLHDRALRAFDLQDFWDAIQLSRQAIEADDGQADFHFLLGRALMQNRRWRKEAADAFRCASEIEPMNVEYLGMLGAIYRIEGLSARADAVLKRVRQIDPDYELPDLQGDAEPTVETS